MNILFASSELSPLAKTGGLGDVLSALPAALRRRGHSVCCVLPMYRDVVEHLGDKRELTEVRLSITMGESRQEARVWKARTREDVLLFLIERDEYYDRSQLYGTWRDYDDNAARFAFFNRCIIELARRIKPVPEIIHAHDWQTGLLPALVKSGGLPFKTVFTIHNLAYQGDFLAVDFKYTGLDDSFFNPAACEYYSKLNFMKSALCLADQLNTVSPTYAREIQTKQFGCGLDGVLREHGYKLTGILNGVDYELWNPETDKHIAAKYSADDLAGKAGCKKALLAEFGLSGSSSWAGGPPVFGMVTRLATQKRPDLVADIAEKIVKEGGRLVVLGSGQPEYEKRFRELAEKHPAHIGVLIGFDEGLAHRIEAGSDFFLMPSAFEPCGLNQMYSLRYGTPPIVHAVGGLADSVVEADVEKGLGTGFLFKPLNEPALWAACEKALKVYRAPAALREIRRRGMAQQFGWDESAQHYEALYALAKRT